ncbi:MAG TPA: MFS transporter [Kofleriaceae bacterium]|nr:MFS transporter [Kofleriaceae bacterium]
MRVFEILRLVSQRSPLLPIFLIVLVDVLGFTIVIPLLGLYAEKFHATPLVATTLVSVYAACSLLSTPVIGRLSDQYGRKPLLMISQAGTCLGFVMLGFSNSLWMVFAGRILDGLTAGNLSIAQAYISDHTAPENRAKAFGVIGVAFGIGFMFGPLLGGWLSRSHGMHMPFIVAAGLSLCSIFATYKLLPKEPPRGEPASSEPGAGKSADAAPGGQRPGAFDFGTYALFFRRPGLLALYAQFFLFSFAFSCFTSGFALFAERRFKTADGQPWGGYEVGLLFGYLGLLGIILQGGLLGRLVKRFGEFNLTVAGFLACAIAYVCVGLSNELTLLVTAATISSFGNGVLRPVITSRLTQAVGRHEQGVAIGISGSLSSFAMMLAPPTGGAMLENRWLLAWTLVPATVVTLGLLATLAAPRPPAAPQPPAAPRPPAEDAAAAPPAA